LRGLYGHHPKALLIPFSKARFVAERQERCIASSPEAELEAADLCALDFHQAGAWLPEEAKADWLESGLRTEQCLRFATQILLQIAPECRMVGRQEPAMAPPIGSQLSR
jgi:hypothetical protein